MGFSFIVFSSIFFQNSWSVIEYFCPKMANYFSISRLGARNTD